MAELLTQTLGPSDGGLNSDAAAHAQPRGQAPVHQNLLLHQPGMMPMRGPIVNHAELSIGTNQVIAGMWKFQDYVLLSLVDKDATRQLEPWVAPYRPVAADTTLALAQGTMKLVNLNTLSVSDLTPADITKCIGGRGASIGGHVYGFAYCHTTTYNLFGTLQWKRKFLDWNVVGGTVTAMTGAPEAGQDVITHLNRIWVLGGVDIAGASTLIQPSALYWCDQEGPATNTAADWEDDATGLTNKIIVDSDLPSDFGVGLAKVGEDMVIFKRRSLHVLSGYSNSTFTLRSISHDIGCLDRRSIVECSEGVYFMSDSGYKFFDGVEIYPMSDNLGTSLHTVVETTVGNAGTDGAKCVATKLLDDYILLTATNQSMQLGTGGANSWAGMLHTPTGHWTQFTCNSLSSNNGVPFFVGNSMKYRFMADGKNVVKTDYLTRPEQAAEATRGFDELTLSSASVKSRINSKWRSPLIPLATPPLLVQWHRFLVDYVWTVDGGTDGGASGWYVTVTNATGTTILAEYQLPSMGDPSSYLYRRRDVRDVFSESSDVQVAIEWRDSGGTYPAITKAEIYDVTVEFSRARQRRST